jgi:hypothetical protein
VNNVALIDQQLRRGDRLVAKALVGAGKPALRKAIAGAMSASCAQKAAR